MRTIWNLLTRIVDWLDSKRKKIPEKRVMISKKKCRIWWRMMATLKTNFNLMKKTMDIWSSSLTNFQKWMKLSIKIKIYLILEI
jgi:hypothetical protein